MSYLKSLLTGLFITLTTVAASAAFPVVSITPASGKTFDNVENFASFNISTSGVTVVGTPTATLLNLDNGDEFDSTDFYYWTMMGAVMIKFDTSEINENGEYQLTIPAGSLTCNGETNDKDITATYTLQDPSLDSSVSYPQITLISSNPADGAKLAEFAGPQMEKITLKTSDDAAVNYIAWTLYDVTNGEGEGEREYLRDGNENRYDLNRRGNNDDAWVNGLYIEMSDIPEKLVKNHKYQLALTFAGIGYDPATNQYPRPDQIEASTELKTSIYYEGLTDAPEYSPYTYLSVSPDPETYSIETVNGAMFTITYSGPVKPVAFNYPIGSGAGVTSAGTWAAVGDADTDGCCDKWEFTFDPSVIAATVGTIYTNVQTKDKDGLYVKGNGDFLFDDINYGMSWNCNVGAPDITLVSPAANTPLESLSSITVSNSEGSKMGFGYQGTATIQNMQGGVVLELGEPAANSDNTQMTWNFAAITTSGSYILDIPEYYFAIGEETSGSSSKATQFRFIVEATSTGEVEYNLEPETVTPAEGEVTEISTITLKFADVTFCSLDPLPVGTLYKLNKDQSQEEVAKATSNDGNDVFNPTEYTFTFDTPVTDPGMYMFVIPKGEFYDEEYDLDMDHASGHANDELAYFYTIADDEPITPPTPGEATFDIVPASVTPADGASVEEISSVVLTFSEATFTPMSAGYPVGKLYNGETEVATSAEATDNDLFNPTAYTFTFATPVTEAGTYKFVVAQGAFCDTEYDAEDGKAGHASPELAYTFIIAGEQDGIADIVAADGTITVYGINGNAIVKNAPAASFNKLDKGIYIINGVKVLKK